MRKNVDNSAHDLAAVVQRPIKNLLQDRYRIDREVVRTVSCRYNIVTYAIYIGCSLSTGMKLYGPYASDCLH